MYDTSVYIGDEGIKTEIESDETDSYRDGRDEQNLDYQIKKDNFYDSQSWNSEIKTEANVDRTDRITLEIIKSEEIDLKYEPVESFSVSSCGNEEMMEIDTCDISSKNVPWNRSYLGQQEILSFTDNHSHMLEHNYSLNIMHTSDKQCRLLCSGTSQDKILTCVSCNFQTESLMDLNEHMLIHVNCPKRKIYNCNLCNFATHWKGALRRHKLSHKYVTEAAFYKCGHCKYKANSKSDLDQHVVVHNDHSEVKMYRCTICNLATKDKFNLITHMAIHVKPSQKKAFEKSGYSNIIYECAQCSYLSIFKEKLNRHIVQVHGCISPLQLNQVQ